jgi:effector-binding domain-containing protein
MKKVLILLGTLLLLGISWYLFIYPYDYVVRMKVKTFPAAITQTLKLWVKESPHVTLLEQKGAESVRMKLNFKDSTHIYQWNIIPVHDSLTRINVYASDEAHSLKNKIMVPFTVTGFEKRTEKTLTDFLTVINEHINNFKVGAVVEKLFPEKTCLCTAKKTSQLEKAHGMMRDYPLLNNTILNYNLQADGPPLIEVTAWDKEEGRLNFNFCYPIKATDSMPDNPELFVRNIPRLKTLKVEYNGNYITSDRAWYVLTDFAQKNDLDITGLPIEVFYNNPNLGGDAMQWKAEVFMPLKDAH